MANKRPPRKSAEDALFEEFLQKQFAQLKRELAEYAPFEAAKENKVLSFEDRITRPKKSRSGWTIGIAAVVLVGVAVPMVIQLNQKKAELTQNAPAAGLEIEKPQQQFAEKDKISDGRIAMDGDEAEEQSKRYYKSSPAKAKRAGKAERVDDLIAGEKADSNLRTSREEAAPKDAFAAGTVQEGRSRAMSDAESTVSKEEEAKPERANDKSGYARMDAPPSAPRPAATAPGAAAPPAAMPAPTVADSRSQSGGNQNAQAEDAAPAEAVKSSRSIAVDDAKSRLKKQDIASDEKAEMEKLWKEFEQDPKSFNQDKKRSARLRTLLSRHNEKSRAKRMKAVETR